MCCWPQYKLAFGDMLFLRLKCSVLVAVMSMMQLSNVVRRWWVLLSLSRKCCQQRHCSMPLKTRSTEFYVKLASLQTPGNELVLSCVHISYILSLQPDDRGNVAVCLSVRLIRKLRVMTGFWRSSARHEFGLRNNSLHFGGNPDWSTVWIWIFFGWFFVKCEKSWWRFMIWECFLGWLCFKNAK